MKAFLDKLVEKYNCVEFIAHDPIAVPHRFSTLQDVEITAFWTAILAWGQRKTILVKATELFNLMDNAPYDFILNFQESDLKFILQWKHRTFQPEDTRFFLYFFRQYYRQNTSLETAFSQFMNPNSPNVAPALIGFQQLFFENENKKSRTQKHIATPLRNATCKRLNMFLRWLVRQDDNGVDFGLWKNIQPHQLLIPLDVHVDRVARHFGLITRPKTDWQTVLELTETLKMYDENDPVKYDFALFGYGVESRLNGNLS